MQEQWWQVVGAEMRIILTEYFKDAGKAAREEEG